MAQEIDLISFVKNRTGLLLSVGVFIVMAIGVAVLLAWVHPSGNPRRTQQALIASGENNVTIVTNHYNQDLGWLLKNTENSLPVVVCSKVEPSPSCQVEMNVGREATAYLKYIVDNYEHLPQHVAFIHGHKHAWHQNCIQKDLLYVIKRCARVKEYGFISLNSTFTDDRHMGNSGMKYLHELWDELFGPWLMRSEPPRYLFHDCCAQFIVSRERIKRLPRDAYIHWYNYFMTKDEVIKDGGYKLGIVFEYMWPIIFGEPDVFDKAKYKEQFRCKF